MRTLIFIVCLVLPLTLFAATVNDAGVYGPTVASDNLSSIASSIQPSSATLQQTIAAVYLANPNAFVNHDINKLKKGYMLTIPSAQSIRRMSQAQAVKVIGEKSKTSATPGKLSQFVDSAVPTSESNTANKISDTAGILKTPEATVTPTAEPSKTDSLSKLTTTAKPMDMPPATKPATMTTTTPVSMTTSVTRESEAQVKIQQIQKQLSSLQQMNQSFQQQTSNQIATLNQQSQNLNQQMVQLDQQLDNVNQRVQLLQTQQQRQQMLRQQQLAKQNQGISGQIKGLSQKIGRSGYVLFGAVVLLFLLLLLYFNTRRSAKAKSGQPSSQELEEEYDFLNSQEGIPAKLDLARAYIDMGDKIAAQKVLAEVIDKGNAEQRTMAENMLAELTQH